MNKREDGICTFHAVNGAAWRAWLEKNHASQKSVWLIIFKKDSEVDSVYYEEAVREALCYGWVDSKPNKRDNKSYFQFFSKRNPKSNWSRKNKMLIQELTKAGKMAESGLEMVRIAKETGTWTALDDVENLVIPSDMQKLLDTNSAAARNWENFPRSAKRGILEWIFNAKRAPTREKRIRETVEKAALNIRANSYR